MVPKRETSCSLGPIRNLSRACRLVNRQSPSLDRWARFESAFRSTKTANRRSRRMGQVLLFSASVTPTFDRLSRTHEDLIANFAYFGEVECPQLDGRIYAAVCKAVVRSHDLLDIAGKAPRTQPPPNLLFAAVHYLLLGGANHPLRQWYPALSTGLVKNPRSISAPFRDFCLKNRELIETLIETRLTQTNVIQRSSALLPCFARVFEAGGELPLSLIEIGCSAGLNLQWERFHYSYDDSTRWGNPQSEVRLDCELRGGLRLPTLPQTIPVAWRSGIDIHPIDLSHPDEVLWLRSLVWPDHVGRQERLSAAIRIARKDPPAIIRGDASAMLPTLISRAPEDTTLCVFATHTLYQFPHAALLATLKGMQAASSTRTIHLISLEHTGDSCSEVHWTVYENEKRSMRLVARANPHGRWLEWIE